VDAGIAQNASGCGVVQPQAGGRLEALAEGNRAYEERFGYIFIVCATGRTGDEMLDILEARLRNDPDRELRIAGEEQRKITRLRLAKLIGEEPDTP
jgi:2-oxo-4-hydroxy-4-carboxy-5-ureidoimidazoline decarboxylase